MEQTAQIGDPVIYTDPVGRDHAAVITNGFGADGRISSGAAINVAYVSGDTSRTDSYGRQIERSTSTQHQSRTPAHGNFWRFADEAKKTESAPSMAHAQA
jgi:hypothetical protein